ncbi:unnamed protein product [Calicophoron daubneyi]|uniref:Uncharacterized protein n=1 Tax=Calicophoron daubneyi TaxID=300641 RepID=A0AAV2T787_CALDB
MLHEEWLDWYSAELIEESEIKLLEGLRSDLIPCERARKSMDCLKRLFLYLDAMRSNSPPRDPSSNNKRSFFHKCVLLGPGIDTDPYGEDLCRQLIQWVNWDLENHMKFHQNPHRLGRGLPLSVPSSEGPVWVQLTILHARTRDERSQLFGGGGRLSGSKLIDPRMPGVSSELRLDNQVQSLIADSDSVIYSVDISHEISSAEFEYERWREIRTELEMITTKMRKSQTLLVLGVCDPTVDSTYSQLVNTLLHLGGVTKQEYGTFPQPLSNNHFSWRLWLTRSDGSHYNNLGKIFTWLARNQKIL